MSLMDRHALVPAARRLLKLASEDRKKASEAMAQLSPEQQVAALCEAPLELRGMLLDLCSVPEQVVPQIPAAELCFTCKHLGVQDASWLMALATGEQIVACLDLDVWQGLAPDYKGLETWFSCLAESGPETLLRSARAVDPEVLALYLRSRVYVELKPAGNEDWEPMDGAQTLEGQFYFSARTRNDDLAALKQLLHVLFQEDYWLYFRMMQSVEEELGPELEEWALRWRTGRLEDMGFPSWDRSMRIYGYLRPEQIADLPKVIESSDLDEGWPLPVWITHLPTTADADHSIFRAAAALPTEEREGFMFRFIALANMIAVADQCELGDAGTLPQSLDKAASVASRGLDHLAEKNGLEPVEVMRRTSLDRLFRVGFNLAPEGIRPPSADAGQARNEAADAATAASEEGDAG
jgi:hypothetical protein